jgi:hypothetical protein
MARFGTFLLHFKDGGRKKTVGFLFVFSSTRSIVLYSPTFNSYSQKLCFLSNGIKTMHILASGPEQLDLGMSFQANIEKKGAIPIMLTSIVYTQQASHKLSKCSVTVFFHALCHPIQTHTCIDFYTTQTNVYVESKQRQKCLWYYKEIRVFF